MAATLIVETGSGNPDANSYVTADFVRNYLEGRGVIAPADDKLIPLIVQAAFKPTPSIQKPQRSVRLSTMEETTLLIGGRHDPCVALRAVPVVEAAAAMSVYDALCMFSKNIPYATGDQDYMGTLELGKFADLAVLDRDLFAIAPQDILNVRVERTMLAGQDTFVR